MAHIQAFSKTIISSNLNIITYIIYKNNKIINSKYLSRRARQQNNITCMSSIKLNIIPKTSFFNIKIPNNMSQQQLKNAIIGAALFSLAGCLYYFIFGKLLGRTSLIQQIGKAKSKADTSIYATVIAGVVFCSAFVKQLHHQHFIDFQPFDTKMYVRKSQEGILAVAGFLVGMGSALAGSFTVGHTIIGLARFNKASVLAVLLFVLTAYLTNKHQLFTRIPSQFNQAIKLKLPSNISSEYYINICLTLPFLFFVIFKDKSLKGLIKYILNFGIGVLFGLGLMVGGLTQRQLVFQTIYYRPKYWNPTILVFFSVSAIMCGVFMSIMRSRKVTPVFSSAVENPKQEISLRLIVGSILFGLGWGLGGLCTASFYVLIPLANIKVQVYWGVSCLLGFSVVGIINRFLGIFKKSK